ncbi:MaoC family dehydratase N-terminal domain-containing protein, partial [Dehalococcoidia bacterium]|nr:MaoC family dehydratase N-terminal domain-containing protein [Dehalococcoidia bacterium]
LVGDYLSVIGATSELHKTTNFVPPTAIATLGIRTILGGLSLPSGAIHVSQELTTHRAASFGETVSCHATVTQISQRKDGQFLVIEFTVADDQAQPIVNGRTTLMVPGLER